MTPIAINAVGHATVRLEAAGAAIIVDPGAFAAGPVFENIDAFLITHDHEDHVDVERVAGTLVANPRSRAWAPATVADRLVGAGAPADRVEAVDHDGQFDVAGLRVRAVVGTHAVIHPAVPELVNIAYLVEDRILHPGDAFPEVPVVPGGLDVLFLPVSGPWMRFIDAADYVAALRPGLVIPVHDGDLNEIGRTLTDQLATLLPADSRYERLTDGRTITV